MSERLSQAIALLRADADARPFTLARSVLENTADLVQSIIEDDEVEALAVQRAADNLPQAWVSVDAVMVDLPYRGKLRAVKVTRGSTVKVAGLGKRTGLEGEFGLRSASDGWKVTGLAQRNGEVNVVVLKGGKEHTVKLDRILGVKS